MVGNPRRNEGLANDGVPIDFVIEPLRWMVSILFQWDALAPLAPWIFVFSVGELCPPVRSEKRKTYGLVAENPLQAIIFNLPIAIFSYLCPGKL